jgi:hypothetical protein
MHHESLHVELKFQLFVNKMRYNSIHVLQYQVYSIKNIESTSKKGSIKRKYKKIFHKKIIISPICATTATHIVTTRAQSSCPMIIKNHLWSHRLLRTLQIKKTFIRKTKLNKIILIRNIHSIIIHWLLSIWLRRQKWICHYY